MLFLYLKCIMRGSYHAGAAALENKRNKNPGLELEESWGPDLYEGHDLGILKPTQSERL